MLEFQKMPGHLIRRLHQISVSVFASQTASAGFDITSVQFAALSAIEEYPGIDQAGLAGLIAYDRVTIGGVVDRLVQKGYVDRQVSPRDRRARELFISKQGTAVLRAMAPIVREVQGEILRGLSAADRKSFIALLRKATEAANEMSRAPLRLPEKEYQE
jgi:DNA-binding MarR family transcriptional regulator